MVLAPYVDLHVSGFDAVEILMKSGKRYRIGTDQPEELVQTILQPINEINKRPPKYGASPGVS
jgi:hypothetical protein